MFFPKRVKFRKWQRMATKRTLKETRGVSLAFGSFGLKAEEARWVSSQQIEAARKAITRYTQRGGKVWIRVFPDKPITKKALGTRMGSGKGDVYEYVAVVKPGRMLFEMGGIAKDIAFSALRLASHKLPVKTRIVEK